MGVYFQKYMAFEIMTVFLGRNEASKVFLKHKSLLLATKIVVQIFKRLTICFLEFNFGINVDFLAENRELLQTTI